MKKGVQMMMLGSICTGEEKTREVLKAIKDAGYDGIELNQYMIHPTSIFVRGLTRLAGMPSGNTGKYDWVKLLKENGLEAVSLHTDLDSLEKDPGSVIRDAEALKVRYIVITGMYHYPYQEMEKVLELAKRLNEAGKKLKEKGYSLLYHNHNVEMVKVSGDLCAYDVLIEDTDPEYVNFEVDAFWLADTGRDPLEVMKRLGSRMKLWHITDRGTRQKGTSMTASLKSDCMELGTGNMDLEGLWQTALENRTEGVILESHRNWIE